MSEGLVVEGRLVDRPGLLTLIKVQHHTSSSGHRSQTLLEQTDLHTYQEENKITKNLCKKDPETDTQLKISCTPCRTVLESVDALISHVGGAKHRANADQPQAAEQSQQFVFVNGKWKKAKGTKRLLDEDVLSHREKAKRNRVLRNLPILPQHTEDKYLETESYFENGLRKVHPYYFTFVAHAKGRWVGQPLIEVFAREFRAMDPAELTRCIQEGLVTVNNQVVAPDYIIENNDFVSHRVHRHELPVSAQPIHIIHQDDEIVVVDKPASMPVHPCGRYRHNSVIFILAKEHGLKSLHTVHRLDRLTSGVLFFCKSASRARHMEFLISQRHVEKEYVCRVLGEFPAEEIICEEPIETISYKIGVNVVSQQGKPCTTLFRRLSYKDGVSIVSCFPKTGRMHQIRVHLQFLGFPIANDPLYNSEIFGPEKGKGGRLNKSHEQLIRDLIRHHSLENWIQSQEFRDSRIETVSSGNAEDDEEGGEEEDVTDILTPAVRTAANQSSGKAAKSAVEVLTEPTAVQPEPPAVQSKSLAIQSETPAVQSKSPGSEKPVVQSETPAVQSKSPAIQSETPAIQSEKLLAAAPSDTAVEQSELCGDSGGQSITSVALSQTMATGTAESGQREYRYFDRHCIDCSREFKDPPAESLYMYLHALRYSSADWSYATQLPAWAQL